MQLLLTSRMVKKFKYAHPIRTQPRPPRSRAGRLGRVHRSLQLAALLKAAVSVKPVALIWELSRMNILTVHAI